MIIEFRPSFAYYIAVKRKEFLRENKGRSYGDHNQGVGPIDDLGNLVGREVDSHVSALLRDVRYMSQLPSIAAFHPDLNACARR